MGNKTWTEQSAGSADGGKAGQREQKRQAVLAAGARLFNDRGYEKTSLADIAAALNITKRTIYYYVQGKEDILLGCLQYGFEFIGETVARSSDKGLPPMQRVALLVEAYAEWISTDLGACLTLTRESSLSEQHRGALRESKAKLDHCLRQAIADGVADGSIRPCSPRLVAATVFGALNWVPFWNRVPEPVPCEEIAAEIIALVTGGLSAG
jgi:AcrR family transcriptional regulator